MNSIITLILILTPMFVGYAIPHSKKSTQMAESLLGYLVYFILIVIGMELGLVKDLSQKIDDIAIYLFTLLILTLGFGLLSLFVYDKFNQHRFIPHQEGVAKKVGFFGSLIQVGCLALGYVLVQTILKDYHLPKNTITILLMLLLFLVGISLKGGGISLKQALINKQGVYISIIFTLSTLFGGAVFSMLFGEVSLFKGLALSSGFGWYSLSGTLMTNAYGAIWGSVALLNDLIREIFALIFIPIIMRHSSAAAIGLGGVTSLDFTLPTITQSGGAKIIPIVISFGFITNIISPVLMVFFSSFK